MYRSMMQIYVKKSDKAVELYRRSFNAELVASHTNEDGTYMHAELDIYGQILAVSEANDDEEIVTGNTMQFCLHFGKGKDDLVKKAYNLLKINAKIIHPLSPCGYSPLMADLIDGFGVRWCIFV